MFREKTPIFWPTCSPLDFRTFVTIRRTITQISIVTKGRRISILRLHWYFSQRLFFKKNAPAQSEQSTSTAFNKIVNETLDSTQKCARSSTRDRAVLINKTQTFSFLYRTPGHPGYARRARISRFQNSRSCKKETGILQNCIPPPPNCKNLICSWARVSELKVGGGIRIPVRGLCGGLKFFVKIRDAASKQTRNKTSMQTHFEKFQRFGKRISRPEIL